MSPAVDRVVGLTNGDYEVHNIGVNWPHHVFLNHDFKVIGAGDYLAASASQSAAVVAAVTISLTIGRAD